MTSLHTSLARPIPRRAASADEPAIALPPDSLSAGLSVLRMSSSTPPTYSMPCRIQLAADDILRTCSLDDLNGLEELEKACKAPSDTIFGRKVWVERLSGLDGPFCAGVFRHGRIMAYIAATLLEGRPDTLFINEVVMRSQWRRQTSSHRILGAYMELMREKGIRAFLIQAKEHLKALYESLGFKCVGSIDRDGESWCELRQSKPPQPEAVPRLRSSTDPDRVLSL